MPKKSVKIIAVIMSLAAVFSLSSCSSTEDEDITEVVAATLPVSEGIPVSESEIIAFYNTIVSEIQQSSYFTAENKPGVKTSESFRADDVKVMSYDDATGEAVENDSLKALNKAAKSIKDRIIDGIDLGIPVVKFGDMNTSISSVIYPYDTDTVNLTENDVISAECSVDGSNMNISIILNNDATTVANTFGIRDKESVINKINSYSEDYMILNEYESSYVNDDENNRHCAINLAVEVEKQKDGTYKCTGRITSLDYAIISEITATAQCKGSFEDCGNIEITFRFTDEKYYEFDWVGTATWEPVSSAK